MQYQGGKNKYKRYILPIMKGLRAGRPYVEPFLGAASILSRMDGERYGYDLSEPLITLYAALRDGWVPPSELSLEEWEALRDFQDPRDPLTAFAGYGCSFGGRFFQGYARPDKRPGCKTYPQRAKDALLKTNAGLAGAHIARADYRAVIHHGCLIYADPPYRGTTGYKRTTGAFDSDEFWATAYRWAQTNTVVVSEVTPPDGPHVLIWARNRIVGIRDRDGGDKRTESLYLLLANRR